MTKSIFIVGTGTDIGKTFISGGIVCGLKAMKKDVCYFKPVQSGASVNNKQLNDIEFVKKISDVSQDIDNMNTYSLEEPLSPHLAAKREGVLIDKRKILKQYENLKENHEYAVIEGAGGVIVPISEDYYIYDLIKDMKADTIVVADSKIGTINQTCLTIDFLKRQGIAVSGIIINNYKGNFYEDDNIKMIERISRVKVKAILENINISNEGSISCEDKILIKQGYDKSLNKEIILELFKKRND